MLSMTSTSSETEVYITPPTSPSQTTTCQFPGHIVVQPSFLDLEFDETRFSLPNKARGICCSVKNVWYSNHHWPEQSQYKYLFEQASETWEKLAPEFNKIWNVVWRRSLATTPWTVELRLAGAHQPDEERVIIKPSVWIRTTDEAIRSSTVWKKLQKQVRKLGLDSQQYASIFAEGGLRSANGPASVPWEQLDLRKGIKFAYDLTLHTHVAWWADHMSVEVSRIGGVLVINASLEVGVTSGHAMLLYFLQNIDQSSTTSMTHLKGASSSSYTSSSDSCAEEDDGQSSSEECELVENDIDSTDPRTDLGYIDLEKVGTWIPVNLSGMVNFIKQAEVDVSIKPSYTKLLSPSTGSIPADFALVSRVEFDLFLGQSDNIYNFNGRNNVSSICPDSSFTANEQEILVLLGNGMEASQGFLQSAKIPFSIGSTTISARKIRLNAPLGRGTSGSWVVLRDSGKLCGAIIAVFEREPFALMMTAQSLFSDIIEYSRDVSLVTLGSCRLDLKDESQALVYNNLGQEVGFRSINEGINILKPETRSGRAMEKSIEVPERSQVVPRAIMPDTTTAPSHGQPHTANICSSMGNNQGSVSDTGSFEHSSPPDARTLSLNRVQVWSPDNVIARISARVISQVNFNFSPIKTLESDMSKTQPPTGALRFPDASRPNSALMGFGSMFDQFMPGRRIDFGLQ